MNIANKLTIMRVFMIPFFIAFLLYGGPEGHSTLITVFRVLAFLTFIIASLTDYVDGKLARKYNLESNFGKLFDPLADKMLVTAAFVGFIELDIFPAWIIILILCREFLVTGLRTLGVTQGRVIHADRWGKHKTVSQIVTIVATLFFISAKHVLIDLDIWGRLSMGQRGPDWWYLFVLNIALYYCGILTVLSGFMYFYKNRDMLHDRY